MSLEVAKKFLYACIFDGDFNAARNILRAGCPEVKPVEMKALALGNKSETIVCEAGNVLKTTTGLRELHCSFS